MSPRFYSENAKANIEYRAREGRRLRDFAERAERGRKANARYVREKQEAARRVADETVRLMTHNKTDWTHPSLPETPMKYLTTELGYDIYLLKKTDVQTFCIVVVNCETKEVVKSERKEYHHTVQHITYDGIIFRYDAINGVLRVYEQSLIVDCSPPRVLPIHSIPEFE